MAKRDSVVLAIVAAVGGCAESSVETRSVAQPALDRTAKLIGVKASTCDVDDSILPLSQVCDTGMPSLYADLDQSAPLAFAKCVWKTFETHLGADEALRFRLQDCSAQPDMPVISVAEKNRTLSVKLGDRVNERPFLSTYEVHGEDAIAFLEKRRKALPASERDRCIIRPYQATDFTARKDWKNLYEIAPNPAYMAEIEARGEPASACGDEGWTNDGVQFWELRDGEAWFWEIGQEAPLYDPRSFTLLQKNETAGAWGFENMRTTGLPN